MATMKIIDFKFDHEAFGMALKSIQKGDLRDFAAIIGIDQSTLSNWQNGRWTRGVKHPSMSNFIKACNALDLDPRQFFVLDEPEIAPGDTPAVPPWRADTDLPMLPEWNTICRMCGKDWGVGSDGFCSHCRTIWHS